MMDMVALSKLRLVGLEDAARNYPPRFPAGCKNVPRLPGLWWQLNILFLDEPSAGLDPITSAEPDQTILLPKLLGMTFVVVTHELPSIFSIADTVVVFDAARKTSGGPRHGPVAARRIDRPLRAGVFQPRGRRNLDHRRIG